MEYRLSATSFSWHVWFQFMVNFFLKWSWYFCWNHLAILFPNIHWKFQHGTLHGVMQIRSGLVRDIDYNWQRLQMNRRSSICQALCLKLETETQSSVNFKKSQRMSILLSNKGIDTRHWPNLKRLEKDQNKNHRPKRTKWTNKTRVNKILMAFLMKRH